MKILGYPDRFSVAPGETVRFMVSCDGLNTYRADIDQLKSFTVAAMIWPTTPAKGRQGLITHWHAPSQKGWGLVIDEAGSLAFVLGDGRKTTTVKGGPPLPAREWCCVGASYDAESQEARVWQRPLASFPGMDWSGDGREIVSPFAIEKSEWPLVI